MTRAWASAALSVLVVALAATPAAAAAPSEQDQRFLVTARQAGLAEIATSRLAQQNGTAPIVRQLGKTFTTDHVELDADVLRVAGELGVALPGQPTAEQLTTEAELRALSGTAFDRQWVEGQLQAHTDLMDAIQSELVEGSDQQVRQLAADAQPVVAAHHDALMKAAVRLSPPAKVDSGLGGLAGPPVDLLAIVGLGMLLVAAGVWLRRRESR